MSTLDSVKHWKTTCMGLVVFLVTTPEAIHFNTAGQLAMTGKNWYMLALGLIAAGIGIKMKDAQ